MAKIYVTEFKFRGEVYSAVITQRETVTSIFVPDTSLHQILPAGRACYYLAEGLQIHPVKPTPQQLLLLSILTSLEVIASPSGFPTV